MKKKKFIAFGSSFVNIFQSLKSENFRIEKFKGAMIKGLLDKNENYERIVNILKNNYYNYAFFNFGDPDCSFYFFKKKYIDNIDQKIIDKSILDNAKKYVKMISEFPNIENKYILNVGPPAILNHNDFKKSLVTYGVFNKDQLKLLDKKDIEYKSRYDRYVNFNKVLQKECKKYNINFCNIFDILLNNKKYIDTRFRLITAKFNVHFNFENVLMVYINTCLSFLKDKKIYLSYDDIKKRIIKSHNDYINYLSLRHKNLNKNSYFYKIDFKDMEKFINKKIL